MSGTITMTGEEYDAMAGELDRVSRELSCLQSVIAEPDELNAEPASDYETLRRQYLSLRLLTNSALARNRYLCRRDDRDMRAALSVNAANVSAERDTNAMLTDLLGRAEAERDALHAEAEALRGLTPELPPRPPEGAGLPRYGLRWNGPAQPLSVPMDDGYWTPWHLAEALRAEIEELDALCNRQSDLLSQAAIALRGPEPALTRYNHADIPLRVKMVVSELEAARGLLEQRIPCDVMLPPATTIKRGCPLSTVLASMKLREDVAPNQRVFTATPAPEVRCQTCDGTGDVHRADGEWLGDCHCVKAEQGERQEAACWVPRACLDKLRNGCNNSPAVLTDGPAEFNDTPLYTIPQPSQDVPGLVEALEQCAASLAWNCFGECRAVHAGPIMPAAKALDTARTALAAHRQAQRQA